MQKEAKARIKINNLLQEAGWRFFDDENGKANIVLPTFRSFNQRDYIFFHKAALRELGSADGRVAGVRRGRAKLR